MNLNIAELEAQLAAARKEEDLRKQALRDSVKPVWRYTIERLPTTTDVFDAIYDDTIVAYKLSGEVLNREELIAAGHPETFYRAGSMRYLYNTVTTRLIAGVGGGTIFLSTSGFKRESAKIQRAADQVGAFLADHPEGGDITEIIAKLREENAPA